MTQYVQDAIARGKSYLREARYSPGSIYAYEREWQKFEEHCREQHEGLLDANIVEEYLDCSGLTAEPVSKFDRQKIRAVKVLIAFAEGTAPPRKYDEKRADPPECFANVHDDFVERASERGIAESTLRWKAHAATKMLRFLHGAGAKSVGDVTAHMVIEYAGSLSRMTDQSRSAYLYAARELARFLVDEHGANPGLGLLFPVIRCNKESTLPSAFDADELASILEESGGSNRCPLMQRAVILLGMLLGMRAGDIRGLKVESVDWRNRRLAFVQEKTGDLLVLPLPEECALALADYMKNERPESESPYVFLRKRAPHEPLAHGNALYNVIGRCVRDAGIDVSGRRHGMHALRHSAAAGMLEGGVRYPVISGVLGHSSTKTTLRYLRVDVEKLRPLSLEVPLW